MDIIFDLNTLIEIFKNYGMFIGSIAFATMLLVKYILNNYNKWKIGGAAPEVPVIAPIDSVELLQTHSFFTNAQYRMTIEIPRLDLIPKKPVRDKVFKDLLIISFQTVYDTMHALIAVKQFNSWTSEQWVDVVTQAVNKIVIITEENARIQQIPEIVIRKFSKWYSQTIEMLHEYILLLGNSKLNSTNVSKTNTLLLIIDLLLVSILGDVERVITEINGELTGLLYKGMTVE